jgi:hypothetical protein
MREKAMSLRAGPVLLGLILMMCGCADKPPPATGDGDKKVEAGHSHERGKMLIADAGEYHALLTAHLSPKGNELDIFFETTDDAPKPVAIPLTRLTAFARNIGEGEPRELTFEPAPADERPKGEKEGTCSHFVAKAPWMKPDDSLTVILNLELGGRRHRVEWKPFIPKKYAHHEE